MNETEMVCAVCYSKNVSIISLGIWHPGFVDMECENGHLFGTTVEMFNTEKTTGGGK